MMTTARNRQALTDEQLNAIWVAIAERENRDRLRGIAYVNPDRPRFNLSG